MTSGAPRVNQMVSRRVGTKVGAVRSLRGRTKTVLVKLSIYDSQSFGLASDGLTLALEVHGVAGARFGGSVAGEESVRETTFTLFIFAFSAIRKPATNVGAHRWPEIVPGERGMYFGVGEAVEVGVVLASEGFAESSGNDDARGEVRVAKDVKAITVGEGIRVDGVKAVRGGQLGRLPFQ